MGLMRGRGRRSRMPRGTATTARSRTRRGRRPASTARRLSFNGTSALVTVPDAASLHLTTGMTLEAWVNPSTVNANWRDVIYKGNDNYYLEATSTNASRPDAGADRRRQLRRRVRHGRARRQHWAYLAETYDGSTLRLYVNGTQVASTAHTGTIATSTNPLQIGGDSIYGQFFAGHDRRSARLQRRADRRPDPDRQTTPVEIDGPDTTPPSQPGTLTANAVSSHRDRPLLGRIDRQRRRHRLPDRALPGRELHQLRPDRDPHRHRPTRTLALTASTSYSYRVRATDAAGNLSPYSNTATATTPTPDTQPPIAAGDADRDRGQRHRDRPLLGRVHRQRRRHRLPGRALPGRELHQLRPDRAPRTATTYKDTAGQRLHQLQLPRPRHRRRRQPQPLLQHRHRHHTHTRHDAAVAAGDADRDRGQRDRDRSLLGRLDRQRRRHRLPASSAARAPAAPTSPRSRTRHRHDLQGHQPSAPPPATATASAPPTPPATSAPTPTPPPRRTTPLPVGFGGGVCV